MSINDYCLSVIIEKKNFRHDGICSNSIVTYHDNIKFPTENTLNVQHHKELSMHSSTHDLQKMESISNLFIITIGIISLCSGLSFRIRISNYAWIYSVLLLFQPPECLIKQCPWKWDLRFWSSKWCRFFTARNTFIVSRPQLVVKTINIKKFYFDINHNIIYELNTLSTGGMTGLAPLWIP